MIEIQPLPKRLDYEAAQPLHTDLMATTGTSIFIDASQVEFCGTLAGQIILSTARTLRERGAELKIRMSEEMKRDLASLNILSELNTEEIE